MMLLTAYLLAALPTTGLVLSNEVGKPGQTSANSHLDAIEEELIASRLAVKRLEFRCDGERACTVREAAGAGVQAIISVSIAWGRKQTSFDLAAIRVSDGASVGQLTFSVVGRLGDAERARVRSLAAQLADALPRDDAPRAEVKEPEVAPLLVPPAPPLSDQPPTRSPLAAVVAGGSALAVGIASGVLLGVASSHNASLQAAPPSYRSQAQRMADTINTEYSASLVLGITAAALAVLTIVLLAKN